jgi:hypothetical protein
MNAYNNFVVVIIMAQFQKANIGKCVHRAVLLAADDM